nr:14335_t:CDS:2 [Entrophospora candida]CAG8555764.1 2267_t:CDS:2 [Entrophospora candida]
MFFSETLLPELTTPKKTSEHDWSDSPSNSRFKHKRSKHPGKKQRTTTTSNSQDYVDLLVFGYEAKLFRDDDMSQKVNNGDLLIPWRGEIENKILLDRYDVRNLLDDRDQFKKVTYTLSRKSEEIQQEKLCEEERWADLDSEAEDLYEMSEEERDIYTEEKRKRKKTKEENKEYEYRYIPKFTVPQGMLTPSSKRIDEIIERTAKFLNDSSDPQMEIVIQAKQANNPSFSFLNKDDSLYPYYKHIRLLLQTGLFAYGNNKLMGKKLDKENVPSEVSAKDINENKKIDERAQYEESSTAQEQISSTSSVGSNIITNNTTNTNSTTTTLTHNTQKQSRPTIQPFGPVIVPPPDLKVIIDKMAIYVAKNGQSLEAKVREKHIDDSRFSFLLPWNEFHPYYKQKIEEDKNLIESNNDKGDH